VFPIILAGTSAPTSALDPSEWHQRGDGGISYNMLMVGNETMEKRQEAAAKKAN